MASITLHFAHGEQDTTGNVWYLYDGRRCYECKAVRFEVPTWTEFREQHPRGRVLSEGVVHFDKANRTAVVRAD